MVVATVKTKLFACACFATTQFNNNNNNSIRKSRRLCQQQEDNFTPFKITWWRLCLANPFTLVLFAVWKIVAYSPATLPQRIPSSFHASISTATHVCSGFKTFFYTSYKILLGEIPLVLLCTYRSKHINPLAANDQFTSQYYATPNAEWPGLPVTSVRVLIRALKRSFLFQIVSIQTLVFCGYFSTRTRNLRKAIYVKSCGSWRLFTTHS